MLFILPPFMPFMLFMLSPPLALVLLLLAPRLGGGAMLNVPVYVGFEGGGAMLNAENGLAALFWR